MKDIVPETAIDRMRQDVKVEVRGDPAERPTAVISIRNRGLQPQTVAEVANALTSSYIHEKSERMRSAQVHGTVNFLAKQLADLSAKLQQLESTAGGFKSRHHGELPEQLGANLKTLDELGSQLRTNSERMTRAVERRGSPEADLQIKELEAEAANLKRQLSLYQARVEAEPMWSKSTRPWPASMRPPTRATSRWRRVCKKLNWPRAWKTCREASGSG